MSTLMLQKATSQLPIGSLDAYIARVNQIPMLTYDQERDLAKRYVESGDINAAQQMVMAHLRFVVKIAKGYAGYGLAINDLIQEGNMGLMKAVKRFDPEVGVRLVSFAVHWIKAEIHEFILRNWRIVKVATTKAQRKLFFNLRKAKKRLGWFTQAEINDVANELGVSSKEVVQMEARLNAHDAAFDGYGDDDNTDGSAVAPVHYLEDHSANPARISEVDDWAEQGRANLMDALEQLDDRSRTIVEKRWLSEPKATLQDLANHFDVSAERIRQLEKNAFNQLKTHLVS